MAGPTSRRAATSAALALGLLVVMTVALRGHVPGAEEAEAAAERAPDHPAATTAVVVLLVASLAVVAASVVTRVRHGAAAPGPAGHKIEWLRAERVRPTWRMALIAFGLVFAWLLVSMLLSSLIPTVPIEAPEAGAPAADGTADGTALEPDPAANPTGQLDAPPEWDVLSYFYVATVVLLLIVVVGSAVAARRRRAGRELEVVGPVDGPPSVPPAEAETLARAAEVGLAEVGDLSREPRKAIIACFAAMERELARVPGAMPQDFDTASEVLARAIDKHALRPDSATELVDLFDEARFSPHVMTETHREAAVAALQRVVRELGSLV